VTIDKYTVRATLPQVREFYERKMPKLGWSFQTGVFTSGGQIVGFFGTPSGSISGLFRKGNTGVLIVIIPKGDSSDIEIVGTFA
jgi:hypothetical protein